MKTRLQDPPNLEAALELLALGFWAHAIHDKGDRKEDGTFKSGKRPIGEGWGLARWNAKRLRDAFRYKPAAGVGVALGPGRGPNGEWMGDLEGDGPEAIESLEQFLGGELFETKGWSSTLGGHNLVTVDGVRLLKLLAEAGATERDGVQAGVWHLPELPGLEIRIGGYKDGGTTVKQIQSVCPPTVGDDGKHREWNGVETIAVLPEAAYSLLAAIAESHRVVAEAEAIKAEARTAAGQNGNGHAPAGSVWTTPLETSLSKYGQKSLQAELDEFSRQTAGNRHGYLIRITLKLAGLVKAGALTEAECVAALKAGARANGMGDSRFHEIDNAWQSGYAMANARNLSHVGARKTTGPRSAEGSMAAGSMGSAQASPNGQIDYATLSDDELGIIDAGSVKEAPIRWLWPYRFAEGEMALLAGDGGLGKSSLLLAIAALITRGGLWPDGSGCAPLGDVIIVSAEDSRETTLKPRLLALGADLARIKFVTAKMTIPAKGDRPAMVHPVSLQDRCYWQEVLRRVPGCKMLIVDPLPSYLGRGVNDAKNGELRVVVEPFIDEVTRPASVCFTANTHLNKNVDAKTPLHRITGSMAYGNLPRNVHFVFCDPDDPDRLFFKQAKCNNAPRNLPAIAYSLAKAIIPSVAGEIETSFPTFEAATVQVDLQEAMSTGKGKRGPTAQKTPRVALWLLEYLRAAAGPSQLRDIFAAAGAMGFVGEYKPDKQGRLRWSVPAILYQAKDHVPKLEAPNDGWTIEDFTNGGVFWRAVQP